METLMQRGVEDAWKGLRTRAPRIAGGVVSAAYIGTVADLGPIPNPRKNLAINICHQVLVNPCQKQAKAENKQVMKMVPLLPNQLLKGTVSQQPITAQHKYGAEFKRPVSQVDRESLPPMPN
jgi:hypothetical protein